MLTDRERATALDALRSAEGTPDPATRALIGRYLEEKAGAGPAAVSAPLRGRATIHRDSRGIPHIEADDPYDLFFAHGYAQAQDRLWQLDFLRRQAHGTLSEIFGPAKLDLDILSRTIGLTQTSAAALDASHQESRDAFHAFTDGINAWMSALPAGLPIEFELLDYEPSPWSAVDCVAVMRRWYWYLTGRLPVLSTPEVVRANIGDLDTAWYQPDGQIAYIVHDGDFDPEPKWPGIPADEGPGAFWGINDGTGSNNWAVSPSMTAQGHAMVGSDPHVYYSVPADWYDVHLKGAGYDVVGMTYPGVPMIRFGRNPHFAWGVTNNICLQRDLYIERVNPDNADEYLDGTTWKPFGKRVERIPVRGASDHALEIRFAHDRPVVDHLVTEGALPRNLWGERGANTVLTLAWVGFELSDEPKSLLDLNRAKTVAEGREALRRFRCPTWNFVLADTEGSVGYQCSGAIPLRGRVHRGYRDANDPIDAWQGYIPFDAMPHVVDPERGWVVSANNPTAPPSFPYPLFGTWTVEDRAARAELLVEEMRPHTFETFSAMQNDVFSGRASRGTPPVLAALEGSTDPLTQEALAILRDWDSGLPIESAGGAIFYVFFWRWHHNVVRIRFPENHATIVQDSGQGMSSALLHANEHDWFPSDEARIETIRKSFAEALSYLVEKLGPEPANWRWGDLHTLGATHPAAQTPLQHEILDMPQLPHPGGSATLSSALYVPPGSFQNKVGASYRIISSLDPSSSTWTITWPGHSGHPGSPHYGDQVEHHRTGQYVQIPYRWEDVLADAQSTTVLTGGVGG
jgi:penicillin amidase